MSGGGPYILVGVNGSQRQVEFELREGDTTIGRAPDNNVVLPESEVSRHHARIYVKRNAIAIEDLESSNHTRVNGALTEGRRTLRPGDVIDLATVRFELRSAASATQPVRFEVGGQSGRTINNVGRDQYNEFRQRNEFYLETDPDPIFEAASGQGLPRFLIVVGMLVAFTGFGLFMYEIFGTDPQESLERGGPSPLAPIGFALFVVGGIVTSIGTGMAKARRRRQSPGWS